MGVVVVVEGIEVGVGTDSGCGIGGGCIEAGEGSWVGFGIVGVG